MGIKKVINIDGNLDDLKKQIILELKKGNKILHPKSNLLDEDLFKFLENSAVIMNRWFVILQKKEYKTRNI